MGTSKPTLLDCYSSEQAMCQAFWKAIKQMQAVGKIKPYAIFHIANGEQMGVRGRRGKINAGIAKSTGVTAGVADYCIPGVGFLEAKKYSPNKRKDGSLTGTFSKTELTTNQELFRDAMPALGMKFEVFRTPNEGMEILYKWGVLTTGDKK